MDMYGLQEIPLRNYDSALKAKPRERYHNSFVIFPVVRTRPCINNYIVPWLLCLRSGKLKIYFLVLSNIEKHTRETVDFDI